MTDKPSEPNDEKEAEDRFNETRGCLLNTPPKPHIKNVATGALDAGKKEATLEGDPKEVGS
jgi:hypothetical protein